jgi:hypothetical protein
MAQHYNMTKMRDALRTRRRYSLNSVFTFRRTGAPLIFT